MKLTINNYPVLACTDEEWREALMRCPRQKPTNEYEYLNSTGERIFVDRDGNESRIICESDKHGRLK